MRRGHYHLETKNHRGPLSSPPAPLDAGWGPHTIGEAVPASSAGATPVTARESSTAKARKFLRLRPASHFPGLSVRRGPWGPGWANTTARAAFPAGVGRTVRPGRLQRGACRLRCALSPRESGREHPAALMEPAQVSDALAPHCRPQPHPRASGRDTTGVPCSRPFAFPSSPLLNLGALEGRHSQPGILNPGQGLYRAVPVSGIEWGEVRKGFPGTGLSVCQCLAVRLG